MKRNIYCLYFIKIAKWFMLTMPILMLFYQDNGLSAEDSFKLKAIYSIAIVIFEIPSGFFADAVGRKTSLIIGSILGTAGFVIYSFSFGFSGFLMAELVLGLGQSFISGSDSAMLYDSLVSMKKQDQYIKYEGWNYSAGNYAESVAALLGGLIAEVSLRHPFYAQVFVAAIGIPAAIYLKEPERVKKINRITIRDFIKTVKTVFIDHAPIRKNLILGAVAGCATLSMAWIYQLYLKDIGYSLSEIGVLSFFLNLLVGVTTLFTFKIERALGRKVTLYAIGVLLFGSYIFLGQIVHPWAVVFLFIFYFARGIATPVFKDYLNRVTSSDIRATVLSLRTFVIRIMFAVIGPFFGWYSDHFTLYEAITIIGVILGVFFILAVIQFLRMENRSKTA